MAGRLEIRNWEAKMRGGSESGRHCHPKKRNRESEREEDGGLRRFRGRIGNLEVLKVNNIDERDRILQSFTAIGVVPTFHFCTFEEGEWRNCQKKKKCEINIYMK